MEKLKTDYKDDILPKDSGGVIQPRRYRKVEYEDGTFSLVDVTDYEQIGDEFGAKDINDITKTVNKLIDEPIDESTIRYNEDADVVQILYEGVWTDWLAGGMKVFDVLKLDTTQWTNVVTNATSSLIKNADESIEFTASPAGSGGGNVIFKTKAEVDLTNKSKIVVAGKDYMYTSAKPVLKLHNEDGEILRHNLPANGNRWQGFSESINISGLNGKVVIAIVLFCYYNYATTHLVFTELQIK